MPLPAAAASPIPTAGPGTPAAERLRAIWERRRLAEASLEDRAAVATYQAAVRLRLREDLPVGRPRARAPRVLRLGVDRQPAGRVESLAIEAGPVGPVSCDFYRPRAAGPTPALIICTDRDGRRTGAAAALARAIAGRGWTALAFDPPGCGARRGPEDLASAALEALWAGCLLAAAGVEEIVRLADYLVRLPCVDARRIAVAGVGEGAGLALGAAALDRRLRAAVLVDAFDASREPRLPAAWLPRHPGDSPLAWASGAFDAASMACALAPRPLLLAGGGRRPRALAAARTVAEAARRACARGGWPERVAVLAMPAGDPIRPAEAIAAWLERALGAGRGPPCPFRTPTGRPAATPPPASPAIARWIAGLARSASERARARLPADPARRREALGARVERYLAPLAGTEAAAVAGIEPLAVAGIEPLRIGEAEGLRIEDLEVRLTGGACLGLRLVSRGEPGRDVLALDIETPGLINGPMGLEEVLDKGWTLALVGTREVAGGGRARAAQERWAEEAAALCAGRALLAERVRAFRLALGALTLRLAVERLALAGRRETAILALLASIAADRCDAVLLERGPVSLALFAGSGSSAGTPAAAAVLPAILQVADLPDLAGLLAPRPLWVLDPQGPDGDAPIPEAARIWERAAEAYRAAGGPDRLGIGRARPWAACLGRLPPAGEAAERPSALRLRPSPAAPRAFELAGRPVFLAGSGRTIPGIAGPGAHDAGAVTACAPVGGNLLRLAALGGDGIAPWPRDAAGRFDLSAFDARYFARIEAILQAAREAGAAILIELFPFRGPRQPVEGTCFDPRHSRGLAPGSMPPGDDIYRAVPPLGGAGLLRPLEGFARRLVAVAAPCPNATFTVGTASEAPLAWSGWWADFLRRVARERGIDLPVGESPPADPGRVGAVLRDPRFAFADVSASIRAVVERGRAASGLGEAYRAALDLTGRSRGPAKPMLCSSVPPTPWLAWTLAFAGAAGVRCEAPAGPAAPGTGGLEDRMRGLRAFMEGAAFHRLVPRPDLVAAAPAGVRAFALGPGPAGAVRSVALLVLDPALGSHAGGRVELRLIAGPLRASQWTPFAAARRAVPAGPSAAGCGVTLEAFEAAAVIELAW